MFRLFPLLKTVGREKRLDPVDKLFSDFSNELFLCDTVSSDQTGSFKVDIKESPEAYWLYAELPGYSQEEIQIEYKGNYLSIVAKKMEDRMTEENPCCSFLRRERLFSRLSRSFRIENIEADSLDASLDKGLLILKIPKRFL